MSQDRGQSYGRRQTAEPRKRPGTAQPQAQRRTALDTDREDGLEEVRGAFEDAIGKEQWNRSKFRYFFGAGLLKGSLRSVRGIIGGSFSRSRGFYDAALGRRSEADVQPVLDADPSRLFLDNRDWLSCFSTSVKSVAAPWLAHGPVADCLSVLRAPPPPEPEEPPAAAKPKSPSKQ